MNNFVVWFEIPVKNMDRAMKFYSTVMSVELQSMDMGTSKQARFPFVPGVASGSLKESKESEPSAAGGKLRLWYGYGDTSHIYLEKYGMCP